MKSNEQRPSNGRVEAAILSMARRQENYLLRQLFPACSPEGNALNDFAPIGRGLVDVRSVRVLYALG